MIAMNSRESADQLSLQACILFIARIESMLICYVFWIIRSIVDRLRFFSFQAA